MVQAQTGIDWNGIQQRFAQEAQAMAQQAQPQIDESTPIGRALSRASQTDNGRLSDLAGFLTQGANANYSSQQAMMGQARDQQITQLEKSYADAVEAGSMSVREAEKMFQEAVDGINRQAYQDAERTTIMSEQMGLSNSAQYAGMVASDGARKGALINQVVTERDKRINDVKDRITNLGKQKALDITNANANYNYGVANQRSQIAQQLSQQMFGMGYDDYNQRQDRMFQVNQMGLQNDLQLGQMAQSQQYNLQNMGLQQKYNQENMGLQHQFDISKMDIQQRYQLEQMAEAFGQDLYKMDVGQQYQLAQMAQSFGYDSALQSSSQNFQAGQNELDRGFKMQQFQMEQEAIAEQYQVELQRELASYGDPNSPEYALRKYQLDSSYQAVQLESQAKLMADVMGKSFADHVGNPPVHPGKKAKDKEIDKYNKQVKAYNEKMNAFMKDPTNMNTFMSNLETAEYNKKKPNQGLKKIDNAFQSLLDGMFSNTKNIDKGLTP